MSIKSENGGSGSTLAMRNDRNAEEFSVYFEASIKSGDPFEYGYASWVVGTYKSDPLMAFGAIQFSNASVLIGSGDEAVTLDLSSTRAVTLFGSDDTTILATGSIIPPSSISVTYIHSRRRKGRVDL